MKALAKCLILIAVLSGGCGETTPDSSATVEKKCAGGQPCKLKKEPPPDTETRTCYEGTCYGTIPEIKGMVKRGECTNYYSDGKEASCDY